MQNKFFIGTALSAISITCFFLLGFHSPHKSFIVHEWGTFTTLHTSDGKRLNGLHKEEEKLPAFVHDSYEQAKHNVERQKGHLGPVTNVNVKMETPVIYFYTDEEQQVDVTVKFPKGSISQWYPQRTKGEETPFVDKLISGGETDFSKSYNGWINWQATVLAANTNASFTNKKNNETKTWITPRNTKSNLVKSNGDVEKFLFYRGLANFSIPVSIKFNNDDEFIIKNTGNDKIPFVFVYEKTESGATCWWSGGLSKGQSQIVNINTAPLKADFTIFKQALVNAGLYEDEAESMLATWEKSYFDRKGLRIFWIVSERLVNELLPLNITPVPDEIKRVFVGRCDVLTPALENKISSDYKLSVNNFKTKYYSDRYYEGYLERVKQLSRN